MADVSEIQKCIEDGDIYQNCSWVSIVNDELKNSFSDVSLINSGEIGKNEPSKTNETITNIKNEHKELSVDDIKRLEYSNISDIELIKYQSIIIDIIRKDISDPDLINNIDRLIDNLSWINSVEEHFSNKTNMLPYTHKNPIKSNSIPRSSYKFCNYNYKCEYNYEKRHNGCYAQHYVHNIVVADINELIKHLKSNNIMEAEVKKCINTVLYVIKHMHEELNNAMCYINLPEKQVHVERTPPKSRKRRNNK